MATQLQKYITTPTETAAYVPKTTTDGHGRKSTTWERVEAAPDHAALLDTIEDDLNERLASGEPINTTDLATALIGKAKRQLMGEILIRLLSIFADSKNFKLDMEILISAAGLPLRDESDTKIAARHGMLKQTFSARKKTLLVKLGLTPPPSSKSLKACETYSLTNRRNTSLN